MMYMKYTAGFLFFTSLLLFWLLSISFFMKTGGVFLVTRHTGQPPLTITRHVPLPQASKTKPIFLDKLQFVCFFWSVSALKLTQTFNRWSVFLQN